MIGLATAQMFEETQQDRWKEESPFGTEQNRASTEEDDFSVEEAEWRRKQEKYQAILQAMEEELVVKSRWAEQLRAQVAR